MKIFQSLWTKPMRNASEDKIRNFLYMAALSALYAKENYYNLTLYTDEYGMYLTEGFPYKERKLITIPEDNPCDFLRAQSKFYALKEEDLGSIHIDCDVFLKSPSIFNISSDWDVLVQNTETYQYEYDSESFQDAAKWILDNGLDVDLTNYKGTFNCGVIGFKNQELKDQYLKNYMKALEAFKNKNCDWWLDLLLEQQYLYDIVKAGNYKFCTLFKNDSSFESLLSEQASIGYTHLIGTQKKSVACKKDIQRVLRKKDPTLYNMIKNKQIKI